MKNKIYEIKIPKNVIVLYCHKKKIVIVKGPLAQKSLKLKVKIQILTSQKLINITPIFFFKIPNVKKKYISAIQGTTASLIKQLILETTYIIYKKLKLIGVGYKNFNISNFEKVILSLKLGYSHSIYFKAPTKFKIFYLKRTNFFLYGNFYQNIAQTASFIRSYRPPEPYKGKGVLYENEKICLKEGKKI